MTTTATAITLISRFGKLIADQPILEGAIKMNVTKQILIQIYTKSYLVSLILLE
jgi:hypothetical protein